VGANNRLLRTGGITAFPDLKVSPAPPPQSYIVREGRPEPTRMASTVTFWQLPSEDSVFLGYLARSGVVIAIRHMEAVPDPSLIRPLPVADLIGRTDAHRVYLTLQSIATQPLPLQRWEPESPGAAVRYSLQYDFPAIVYDAGTLADCQLSQSNAAAYPSRAPPAIAKWMRRVFAWLRRVTPQWHEYRGYRVTELAAKAALDGLSLVPYHGWRGPSTGESSFAPRDSGTVALEREQGTSRDVGGPPGS
jgi:hypothetical protein